MSRDPAGRRPARRLAARSSAGLLLFALVTVGALAALFDRTWRHGEVFSPADALWLFYPWAYDTARPIPSNTTRTDEAFYHQPMMVSHWARLKAGDFPEWDPLVLSGTPAFQQGLDVGRAFSPLSLPFYLASPDVAVTLYAPLRLLVAALLMWAWLRHRGHSAVACAAGGLAWAFNGAFITWLSAPMPTVALWLPLILLGVDRSVDRGRPRDVALLATAIGLSLLGAYLPTSLAVLTAAAVYAAGLVAGLGHGRHADRSVACAVVSPSNAILRLAIGAVTGVALAAVALLPMLANLVASPARTRTMNEATLPWANLATLAMPDFWGSPLARTWWYPGAGNYPEFVTYLGVTTLALAGGGALAALHARDRRALVLAALAAFALCVMYGWPPASWVGTLPGFRQMNPYRWNVVLAFGVAALASMAIDVWSGHTPQSRLRSPSDAGTDPARVERRVALGVVVALVLMGLASAAALWSHLDDIRRLNLQGMEKRQLLRFAVLSAITIGLTASGLARRRSPRWRQAGGLLLVALIGLDLLSFGRGFNPTIPRERLYPSTPGLERLRAETGAGRIAPIDTTTALVPGHVWSVFGLEVVTGFDFFGDGHYQRLLGRASAITVDRPRWDAVDLPDTPDLDLRLLGLLGVTTIVTAPIADVPSGTGYAVIGELTHGRRVVQRFDSSREGLRAVDVLCATYGRENAGSVELALREVTTGRRVATRTVEARDVPDNGWLRLEFPPQPRGAYAIEVTAREAGPGRAITLWATASPAASATPLTIDDEADARAIWFRTFATAPDRWPDADLIYSADLNIYRNRQARPRAWFVAEVEVAPRDAHLTHLAAADFDLATRAIVDTPVSTAPSPHARVLGVDHSAADRRVIDVEAPAGGVLVVSERFAQGWHAQVDGVDVPLVVADSVLMALAVGPGARRVVLTYHDPTLLPSGLASSLAGIGIALAAFRRGWRRSATVPATD